MNQNNVKNKNKKIKLLYEIKLRDDRNNFAKS